MLTYRLTLNKEVYYFDSYKDLCNYLNKEINLFNYNDYRIDYKIKKVKRVFRKDLYLKRRLKGILDQEDYDLIKTIAFETGPDGWVSKCDGKEVINGWIDNHFVLDIWCEEIEIEDKDL